MDLLSRLTTSAFFENFPQATLANLTVDCEWVPLLGGQTLFNQGDDGDALYVIVSGRLRVSLIGRDGSERLIREIGPGESVGELALLARERRSATVRAIRDTELVRLSREGFARALEREPKILQPIAKVIAERQQNGYSPRALNSAVRTIAVVPIDPSVATRGFVDRLVRALASLGTTLTLHRAQAESFAAENGISADNTLALGGKLVEWLRDVEEANRFVVFVAGTEKLWWDRLCMRQADRIFLLAAADGPLCAPMKPDGLIGELFHTTGPRTDLVIIRSDASRRVSGTRHWLANAKVAAHHHVQFDSEADFQKLARDVSGASIGLVLGGGGARGFAHIGVIRALAQARIPIDYVGGTSMGSVIAGQFASGWDYQDMLRMNEQSWVKLRPHWDFTIPIISFMSGHRMSRMIKRMFGKTEIEDLPTPFFCVSTNLTRAELMVHQSGPLWRAVRSSIALPGAISPVITNREIFVDGGLVDNLPVNVMRQCCAGPVIAVDVGQKIDLTTNIDATEDLSGGQILWSRLNPFTPKILMPGFFSLLQRATTLNSDRAAELVKSQADLSLEPPVGRFSTFDWSKINDIAEAGYRYAAEVLEQASKNSRLSRL